MTAPRSMIIVFVFPIKRLRRFGLDVVGAATPIPAAAKKNVTDYDNHSGVAIVSKPGVAIAKMNTAPNVKTFEQQCCRIISKGSFIVLTTIYLPGSEPPTAAFFKEFATYL